MSLSSETSTAVLQELLAACPDSALAKHRPEMTNCGSMDTVNPPPFSAVMKNLDDQSLEASVGWKNYTANDELPNALKTLKI
ncbi:unnamed protein product, partial [Darwinula stevensoni]